MENPKSDAEWTWLAGGTTFSQFSGRDLNIPGTLIKLDTGIDYLIGDINPQTGVCDDCVEHVTSESIVVAYKVIWRRDT